MKDDDNDDLFSEFGSDGIDPEKYKEYLKKMYKDLTGEELSEDIEFMGIGGKQDFLQDLSNEEEQEIFNDYIREQDMKLEIEFNEIDGIPMVEEIWTPDDKSMNIKRAYQYDHFVLSTLDIEIQKKIYDKKLGILVEKEEYEEAAEVRDILNDINSI